MSAHRQKPDIRQDRTPHWKPEWWRSVSASAYKVNFSSRPTYSGINALRCCRSPCTRESIRKFIKTVQPMLVLYIYLVFSIDQQRFRILSITLGLMLNPTVVPSIKPSRRDEFARSKEKAGPWLISSIWQDCLCDKSRLLPSAGLVQRHRIYIGMTKSCFILKQYTRQLCLKIQKAECDIS